jgi:hypothetical protein
MVWEVVEEVALEAPFSQTIPWYAFHDRTINDHECVGARIERRINVVCGVADQSFTHVRSSDY